MMQSSFSHLFSLIKLLNEPIFWMIWIVLKYLFTAIASWQTRLCGCWVGATPGSTSSGICGECVDQRVLTPSPLPLL
jgi:hypothetical protein